MNVHCVGRWGRSEAAFQALEVPYRLEMLFHLGCYQAQAAAFEKQTSGWLYCP